MKRLTICLCFLLPFLASCQQELIEYREGNCKITIEPGEAWLHDYPLFLGIKKKNPPQLAVWLEDPEGNYLATLYATYKIAAEAWQGAHGNRRKEALPHWCHTRGVVYEDGLYLPTKEHPLTDCLTGATPRGGFDIKVKPGNALTRFVVKIEINHSTDFNAFYPELAGMNDAGYSGGKEGSGQPAVVYAAGIDLSAGIETFEAALIGHSSADGNSGELDTDLSGLTTALRIVKRIAIEIQ